MKRGDFPKDFYFGTATAAYQIEGAYKEDGKGLSVWDVFCQKEGAIENGDTGNVACDHYHRYEEDVEIMKDIGLNAYRFSISWPRVMPDGVMKNQKGIDFYHRLIDKLLENGITPFITLYHWDLPYELDKKGGWLNPDIASYFKKYAEEMFKEYGDKVKHWITVNEPWSNAFLGYFFGEHAPGHRSMQEAITASHNMLRAHGYAVKAFREVDKGGEIGLTNVTIAVQSHTNSFLDRLAARFVDEAINGWFYEPVINGRYPKFAKTILKLMGVKVPKSDFEIISQPIDFFGVNYYTRIIAAFSSRSFYRQVEGDGPKTEMGWEIYPQGLYDVLVKAWKDSTKVYNPEKFKLYITENGIATPDKLENGIVNDQGRIDYLMSHMESVLRAIKDGVNVKGYFIWSLMDNFEWAYGYSKRFGIVYVDYQTLNRYLKESAKWLKTWLEESE